MGVLKQVQKNQILQLAKEAGLNPADFIWTEPSQPAGLDDSGKPDLASDILQHRTALGTRLLIGYHHFDSNGHPWTCYAMPFDDFPHGRAEFGSFEESLAFVQQWLRIVVRELSEPVLWSETVGPEILAPPLLRSQFNTVFRELTRYGADLTDASWAIGDDKALLILPVGDCFISFGRNLNAFEIAYSPGEIKKSGFRTSPGWDGAVEVIKEWASRVAEEQKAHLSPVVASSPGREISASTRLTSIRLNNIRSFRDFHLPLLDADANPRMSTLVIGLNGAGKSTLLRAISVALCPRTDANVLLAYPQAGLVDLNSKTGTIELGLTDETGKTWTRTVRLSREGDKEEVQEEEGARPEHFFVYASGIGRAVESQEESKKPAYRILNSVGSLFRYDTPMATAELTLRRARELNGSRYPALIQSLKRVLDLQTEDDIQLPLGGGVIISGPSTGLPIPLSMWADGYRLTMGWMLDLFAQALSAEYTEPDKVPGLLLIDEVERHLHPSMQAALLGRLRAALPNLQIIATTHSPMVAMGALGGDLVLLKPDESGAVHAVPGPRSVALTVEDLITDDRGFDSAPYAPEVQALIDEYNSLAAVEKTARSDSDQSRLRELSRELSSLEVEP